MATLTGKIIDVTSRPPDSISSITVKAPAARVGGSGGEVVTTSPATVNFDSSTGNITISNLTGGLSWLYIEGNGWSDSIALSVAEGMVTLVEAVANAAGAPGLVDYVRLLDGLENRVDGIAQGAVDAAAAGIKYVQPALTSSSNVDALTSGLHPVPTSTVATALGMPYAEPGELVTTWLDSAGARRRQTYYVDKISGADAGLRVYRRWYSNGTWQPWTLEVQPSTPYFRGAIPDDITPDEMTDTAWVGEWTYHSGFQESWGIPHNAAGLLTIGSSGTSTLQELTVFTTPIQKYQRRAYVGTWSGPWKSMLSGGQNDAGTDEYYKETSKDVANMLVPSVVDPTLSYASDHAALVSGLKSRLGTVSTGGRAAVALVADHGTTAFKEWMWQAAKDRGIPFTMALSPEIHLDEHGDSRDMATNVDIKQWISEGLVIASHSGDHEGATGYFDVHRQIVTSRQKLEEKLNTPVDAWVQPGYSTTLGTYDGFGSGQSASRYTDYYAGRLLQQTYPVITGYAGDDFVYPGGVDLPVGVRRSLTERKENQASVLANIEQAISTGGKHINFCHPYALVNSSNTYVIKSEYIAYLDWLVEKRDAGDLVLLTLPELAIANVGDLAIFTGTSINTSGYVIWADKYPNSFTTQISNGVRVTEDGYYRIEVATSASYQIQIYDRNSGVPGRLSFKYSPGERDEVFMYAGGSLHIQFTNALPALLFVTKL